MGTKLNVAGIIFCPAADIVTSFSVGGDLSPGSRLKSVTKASLSAKEERRRPVEERDESGPREDREGRGARE